LSTVQLFGLNFRAMMMPGNDAHHHADLAFSSLNGPYHQRFAADANIR
jgi:hypothetical protein